ncbi:unnamed protein product [Ranitomeya imitator]|uniref:SGNH hydrolase-type esterase domain-containing protein n=1 Tax=Ranitomeya imitator TaxID=111125 RepID=A0ABN9LH10_9NEOB|nr:unnamed protein product [Ranitomeya imitator]
MRGDDQVGALLLWLRRGADDGWSASKVERIRSALAFGFQLRGLRDLTKLFLVRQAVKGFTRRASKGDLRRPISFGLLERIGVKLSEICTSDFEVALFRLAFSLAFFLRAAGSNPLLIWIVGHSYVYWGARRADVRRDGRQLGFSKEVAVVRWLGFRGLGWNEVLKEVHNNARLDRIPDILVLHVGGNDLGIRPCLELIRDIKHDLLRLWASFGDVLVVWSDIVPRRCWRHARSADKVNKARIKVNRAVAKFVVKNGGLFVRHLELEQGGVDFLLGDGVHLNAVGTDLWSLDLQNGIERAIAVKCGGVSGGVVRGAVAVRDIQQTPETAGRRPKSGTVSRTVGTRDETEDRFTGLRSSVQISGTWQLDGRPISPADSDYGAGVKYCGIRTKNRHAVENTMLRFHTLFCSEESKLFCSTPFKK